MFLPAHASRSPLTDKQVQPSPSLDSDVYGEQTPPAIAALIAHLEQAGLQTPDLFAADVRAPASLSLRV